MGYDRNYVWVVVCKNHIFHNRHNVFFGHKIPLSETDAVEDPPALKTEFSVRCDECGKEYSYKPKELLRVEMELPDSFAPHPLFQ